jgi:hypothetical protein
MIKVRRVRKGSHEPPVETWIMVEMREGSYHVTGKANGLMLNPHVSPGGFEGAETAMQAALKWADYLGLEVIYVKEHDAGRSA